MLSGVSQQAYPAPALEFAQLYHSTVESDTSSRAFEAYITDAPPPLPPETSHLREPTPPKLEGQLQRKGNSLKVNWIKQDDGGSPIMHYLVRYKAKSGADWKPEIRLPNGSEYVVLSGLEWDTEYDVYVVAENQQGKSQPGMLSFRTSPEPTAIPGSDATGLGMGAIAGILIVVFVLLLVGVDVTCYFINKCGLLMCIAVNICGKSGPGAKSKDMEEGKAAFTTDESKEPIVEVRTEEECTPNHDGGVPGEPNETTPLTEPEKMAIEEKSKPKEVEVKKTVSEVQAVPNEAAQTNANESKA
ncbi:hypothetical protein JZ751_002324 [Albula glossodonta]|uniref:Fibronectin type-III domain-containing protein n=1 Tax=Albula glossodonta TaxID=121402 RepID=A0A8T2PGH9_9TELE|nr:hypothetical protein JZ751_002324 [Albula glossodonta]